MVKLALGVSKPDRRIFELAIKRSGFGASLGECTFTTENTEHLAKCKGFGMIAIRFGSGPGITPAFSHWADAPGLFAGLLSPADAHNQVVVIAAELSARHNLVGFVLSAPGQGREYRGQAKQLVELKDPKLGDLNGVYVELPTEVTVSVGKDRRVANVAATAPSSSDQHLLSPNLFDHVSNGSRQQRLALGRHHTFPLLLWRRPCVSKVDGTLTNERPDEGLNLVDCALAMGHSRKNRSFWGACEAAWKSRRPVVWAAVSKLFSVAVLDDFYILTSIS